jgi:hypothetical protein
MPEGLVEVEVTSIPICNSASFVKKQIPCFPPVNKSGHRSMHQKSGTPKTRARAAPFSAAFIAEQKRLTDIMP